MTKYKTFENVADAAAALGDISRLRAVLALCDGELCACQLIALLELAPSTVSRHMAILRQSGLVEARKEGRWMYYRLPKSAIPLLDWAVASAGKDLRAREDRKRLKQIKSEDPDALCRARTFDNS